ncbi:MAG TPA: nucleotide sugar dehydrogenase [Candidatus Limnocylindria bacterium]|nr:nucleotide sugar dehydrogenase [Candidatus Limnocylindria bacterium]
MSDLELLRTRIAEKQARIVVVGLGYVGVPVAVSFAAAGFEVVGLDPQRARVDALQRGELPLATSEPGLEALLRAALSSGRFTVTTETALASGRDIAIVAVDTPLQGHAPDTRQLQGACRTISGHLARPGLVVIESTVAPRTMREIVAPLFAPDVAVVHCPERVRPGRLLRNLRGMSRLIGVADPRVGALATELYANVVQADLVVTDWETAEVIKTAENAARDVQIALANQLAVISDHAGVDVRKVRDQINRLWADQPLILDPGAGVGGHCLPKDPWLLVSTLPADASRALIEGARALNESMPAHAARITLQALSDDGVAARGATVAVLGLTYEASSDDERNAPGPRVAAELERAGAVVARHDPFVTRDALAEAIRGADAVVVVIPHGEYRDADWAALGGQMRRRVFVDCRRAFEADALRTLGFSYRGLGVAALR